MVQLIRKLLKSMSGLKVGEIDIGDQVLDNEYKIKLLFKLLQKIIEKNPTLQNVTQQEFETIKKNVEKELQDKYPKSDVKIT